MRNKRKVALGASASAAVNVIKAVIQILMVPLMGRLLGPAEFGLYALALPAVGLLSTIVDGGFGVSLAREPESGPVWSTAFWVTLASGVAMAIVMTGWGFVLGQLIHEPRVVELMALLSVSLVMMSLSVCPDARLVRRGRLDIFAGTDLVFNPDRRWRGRRTCSRGCRRHEPRRTVRGRLRRAGNPA